MPELYGIDCLNPQCVHDRVGAYRLILKVRPLLAALEPAARAEMQKRRAEGRGEFVGERNPTIYRESQLDAAYAQMDLLGGDPRLGAQMVTKHHSLPPGCDARLILLLKVPMPRIAMYFRWCPEVGEMLTPDKVFQCVFAPGSTQAERAAAAERQVTPEEFANITRKFDPNFGLVTRESLIRCQHCHEPLPLRAFNILTLRQVEKGE